MNFIYTITLEDQETLSTRLQIGDEVDSHQLERTLHYLQVAISLIHEMSLHITTYYYKESKLCRLRKAP